MGGVELKTTADNRTSGVVTSYPRLWCLLGSHKRDICKVWPPQTKETIVKDFNMTKMALKQRYYVTLLDRFKDGGCDGLLTKGSDIYSLIAARNNLRR